MKLIFSQERNVLSGEEKYSTHHGEFGTWEIAVGQQPFVGQNVSGFFFSKEGEEKGPNFFFPVAEDGDRGGVRRNHIEI